MILFNICEKQGLKNLNGKLTCHTGNRWQSQGENPGLLIPSPEYFKILNLNQFLDLTKHIYFKNQDYKKNLYQILEFRLTEFCDCQSLDVRCLPAMFGHDHVLKAFLS